MDKEQLIARLAELKAQIPGFQAKGVSFRDDPVFTKWHKDVVRFLRVGGDNTVQEVQDVEHLWFKTSIWGRGDGYSRDDMEYYKKDLNRVDMALDAAIENLNLNLVPKLPEPDKKPRGKASHSVVVHSAGTVVAGENNLVNIIGSITVAEVLSKLDKEIENRVADEDHKEGLRAQVKALAKHPAFTPILTLGLKSMLGL